MSEKRFSGEQPPKKFEINQLEEKKKFQINNSPPNKFEVNETPNKKFVIHTESGRDVSLEWFQQKNSNDCGPCLLLNGLHLLRVESIPNSIEEVRSTVNNIRRENRKPELPPNGWFTSEDVGEYLARIGGMEVEEYPVFPYDADNIKTEIEKNITEKGYDLMYTTVGSHFRAITPSEESGRYYLLDSFFNEPQVVDESGARELLDRTVNSRVENRVEKVGVARRSNNPVYTVKF